MATCRPLPCSPLTISIPSQSEYLPLHDLAPLRLPRFLLYQPGPLPRLRQNNCHPWNPYLRHVTHFPPAFPASFLEPHYAPSPPFFCKKEQQEPPAPARADGPLPPPPQGGYGHHKNALFGKLCLSGFAHCIYLWRGSKCIMNSNKFRLEVREADGTTAAEREIWDISVAARRLLRREEQWLLVVSPGGWT